MDPQQQQQYMLMQQQQQQQQQQQAGGQQHHSMQHLGGLQMLMQSQAQRAQNAQALEQAQRTFSQAQQLAQQQQEQQDEKAQQDFQAQADELEASVRMQSRQDIINLGRKGFQCRRCGKEMTSGKAIKYHLDNFVCLKSDAIKQANPHLVVLANTLAAVRSPKNANSSDKSYQCEECGKELGTLGALKYHRNNRVCTKPPPQRKPTAPPPQQQPQYAQDAEPQQSVAFPPMNPMLQHQFAGQQQQQQQQQPQMHPQAFASAQQQQQALQARQQQYQQYQQQQQYQRRLYEQERFRQHQHLQQQQYFAQMQQQQRQQYNPQHHAEMLSQRYPGSAIHAQPHIAQLQQARQQIEAARRPLPAVHKTLPSRKVGSYHNPGATRMQDLVEFYTWDAEADANMVAATLPSWGVPEGAAPIAGQEAAATWEALRTHGQTLQILVDAIDFDYADRNNDMSRRPSQTALNGIGINLVPLQSVTKGDVFPAVAQHRTNDVWINVGGRVTAMDFCPAPGRKPAAASLLAVGTATSYETLDVLGVSSPTNLSGRANTIQIWALRAAGAASLAYGVRLDKTHGSVLALQWCPSQKSPEDKERQGLLAVATASGAVLVLAMPLAPAAQKVFDAQDLAVFSHEFAPENKESSSSSVASFAATCTCLSWSTQEPWDTLFCGLSDGSVAVWDLKAISAGTIPAAAHQRLVPPASEMSALDDGPVKMAALRSVTDLACDAENDNLVVTISRDRALRLWDLRLPHRPVVEKSFPGINLQTVSWPANADFVILGDDIGQVSFLSLQDGMLRRARVHRDGVTAAAVNPRLHPTLLATCSVDGLARTWVLPTRVRSDLNDIQAMDAISSNDKNVFMCTAAANRPGEICPPSDLTLLFSGDDNNNNSSASPSSAVVVSNEDMVVPSRQYRFTPNYVVKASESNCQLPSEITFSAVAWGASFEPTGSDAVLREWLAMATRTGFIRCKLADLPRVPIAWPHDTPAPNVPYPQFVLDQHKRIDSVKM